MNRIVVIFLLLAATAGMAQKKSTKPAVAETKPVLWKEDIFSNLKFRSIGPAFMAGRIADIAIHPQAKHRMGRHRRKCGRTTRSLWRWRL